MSKVGKDVAEAEFERMCEARRVCTDADQLDADDITGLADIRKKLVRAIVAGHLVVEDNGDPVYTPPVEGAKPLHFHKPTSATYMAMDGKADDAQGSHMRMVRAITEMTRSNKGEVSKLEAPDYQVCQSISQLFLASR
jgi:hypothetical protein